MRTPSPILRYVARPTVPFIQLYALYVLGHGEDGPGGGFQGGVIFAASIVLLALTEGWHYGRRQLGTHVTDALMPFGCLVYSGIGALCLLGGGAFLAYEGLSGSTDPHVLNHMHHYGLMGIEAGVMITVTSSMIALFFEMSRPEPGEPGAEGAGGSDG
jgi:multicomponent Na+:H+ antiporter subunit B